MMVGMNGDLVLTGARVWADADAAITDPQMLSIESGRIVEIGRAVSARPGVRRLDLAGRILTAGFWNCHVHLIGAPWGQARSAPRGDLQSALDDMLLRRGFTTILDLASHPLSTRHLVRRIAAGDLRGPEIITAGAGIRPSRGIPFYVAAHLPWCLRWLMPGPSTRLSARITVAGQALAGATLTKLFTGSYVTPTHVKPMRLSVARAAVREAHGRGMRVFAHPSNAMGADLAIRAGVDALAHLPDSTDGTEHLLAEAAVRGIRVVPTLHMFATTVTTDEVYLAPIRHALRQFRQAGGRVLFGTDAGYTSEWGTRGEFEAMDAAGMSAADILRSLTSEPAAFMGRSDVGTVAPGRRADLTVLEATSIASPSDFAKVASVIRDGRVVYGADAADAAE